MHGLILIRLRSVASAPAERRKHGTYDSENLSSSPLPSRSCGPRLAFAAESKQRRRLLCSPGGPDRG
jgi:hypothetical protein